MYDHKTVYKLIIVNKEFPSENVAIAVSSAETRSKETDLRALDQFEMALTKDNRIKIDRKAFDVV